MVSGRRKRTSSVSEESPAKRLAGFIANYDPKVASLTRAALKRMRARLPGAVELVYDNYNALAVGFGPTERVADLVFSITSYPRWVSLFFTHGAGLPDPGQLLKGSGSRIRHIVLENVRVLDDPAVKALMAHALERSAVPIDASQRNRIVIKSVSARQRPRRSVPSKGGSGDGSKKTK
jgi:hypothetical protein